MEGTGSSRFCFKNNNRVSHTLSTKASLNITKSKKRSSSHSSVCRNGLNNSSNETAGNFEHSSSCSKLYIPYVPSTEKRRLVPAHIQSKIIESVCFNRSLSFNKHEPCSGVHSIPRLDVQSRPIASLFQRTDNPVTKTISATLIQGRSPRNDLPAIRPKHSSEGIRLPHKLGSTNPSGKEHQNNCLPRRFPTCTSKSSRAYPAYKSACKNTRISRFCDKLRKVCSCSTNTNCFLRHCMGPLEQLQKSASRKVSCCGQQGLPSFENGQNIAKRASKPYRSPKLCQFCCTSGQTEPPVGSNVFKYPTEAFNTDQVYPTSRSVGGNALVASKQQTCFTDARTTDNAFSNHGCLRYSMGSPTEQSGNVRRMGLRRKTSTLQPERDASYLESPRIGSSEYEKRIDPHSVRQPFCDSISPQRGRDQVPVTIEVNSSHLTDSRQISNSIQNTSYSGEVQQPRRSFIEAPTTSGMASNTELHGDDICKNGNTRNRLIRVQDRSSTSQLRNTRSQRSRCDVPRRVQYNVEFPTGMGISSTVSYSPSSDAPQSSNGCVFDSGSTVGEGILASGFEIASNCRPVHHNESKTVSDRHNDRATPTQSSRHDFGNLEMWGWGQKIKKWDSNQISLLKSSWRPSTLNTYRAPWKRWVLWSKQHSINPFHPEGSELAQFLADLHLKFKLSYNTILLHKSVISTLCNAELSGKLSKDVLVKHILKSISMKNPNSPKPPIWDVSVLITYMNNYSIDNTNAFQIVRHTAALLCLCSGRRIHDLTLLCVDKEHCYIRDDCIIMWPLFGSKTDCREYRQSGWKLLNNTEKQNLNPVYWINKTINILYERRKSSGSSNLFITLRGSPSPASRSVIAGWLKSILKEAGILDSPGSVRAAVASRNWINNCPIDDILARSNWKSLKTFQKFYCREVIVSSASNHTSNSVASSFNTMP